MRAHATAIRTACAASALWLGGCGLVHRTVRLAVPTQLVTPPEQAPDALGTVAYVDDEGQSTPYAAEPYATEPYDRAKGTDEDLVRPMVVDGRGSLRIDPTHPGTHLRVFVRNTGLRKTGFVEVVAVTGARAHEWVDEVRYLPGPVPLDGPYTLPVCDIANVHSGYRVGHNDLVLVELSHDDQVQRALFQNRRSGWHFDLDSELMVRSPLSPVGDELISLSPAITGGLELGYRLRGRSSAASVLLDQLTLVTSIGIGTTTLSDATKTGDLTNTVDGVLIDILWGGGVKALDLASVQVLGNPGAIRGGDPRWTLALGLDLWKLREFSWALGTRVLHKNTLSDPPQDP